MKRGKFGALLGVCALGVAVACGSSDDENTNPTNPTADAGDASSSTDAGSDSAPATDSGIDSGSKTVCNTGKTCPSGQQCQRDNQADDLPRGTCESNPTCVFIPDGGKAPVVDPQCNGVEPCLGFVCVPPGIVAGPTGIFQCGSEGDTCTGESTNRCCHPECPRSGICPMRVPK